MENFLEFLGVAAVVVLLPIVPALLIYKYVPPGRTVAAGPFRGLQIKLTGSFAGYFVVLLVLLSFAGAYWKLAAEYEPWTVRGKLFYANGRPVDDERAVLFQVQPPTAHVAVDGNFTIVVPVDITKSEALPIIRVDQLPLRDGGPVAVSHLESDPLTTAARTRRSLLRKTIWLLDSLVLTTHPSPYPDTRQDSTR
jgi:hypothetical protein